MTGNLENSSHRSKQLNQIMMMEKYTFHQRMIQAGTLYSGKSFMVTTFAADDNLPVSLKAC